MKLKQCFSLRTALYGLMFGLILLPTLTLGPWLLTKAFDALLTNAILTRQMINIEIADDIEHETKRLFTALRNKSDAFEHFLKHEATTVPQDEFIHFIMQREPNIQALHIINRDGEIIAKDMRTSEFESPIDYPVKLSASPPALLIPLHGHEHIGSYLSHEGEHFFHIALPIGLHNQPFGVIVATISIEGLWSMNLPEDSAVDATRYLVDSRGSLMTSIGSMASGQLITEQPVVRSLIAQSEWNSENVYIGVNNKPAFGALTIVQPLGWGIISEISKDAIYTPIKKALAPMVAIVIIIITGFLLLAVWLVRKVMQPFVELTHHIQQASAGDYTSNAPSSRITEFNDLSEGFNTMVKAINHRQQLIQTSLKDMKQAEMAALNMMEDANVAREQLQEIHNRHEEAQRIAHLGHWSLDLVNNDLVWSDENYRIFGVAPGVANTYETFLEIVHPDDYELIDKAYTESVKNRTPYDIEHRLLMQDGSIKWVHERCETEYADDGAPLRSIGTTMDITARKKAEQLVHEENHVLEMLSEGKSLKKVLKTLNLMVEAQVPDSYSSILIMDESGKHLLSGSAPHLPKAWNAAIDGVAIGPSVGSCGTAAYRDETVIVKDIGTDPLWEDYRDLALAHGLRACWSVPIRSSEGKVLGTFALYHDRPCDPAMDELKLVGIAAHAGGIAIERRQAEGELHRHREHLEEMVVQRTRELEIARDLAQSANRAKSTFLANMSHELRTPLNSILGFSELLSLDKTHPMQSEQQTHLGFIMESGNRLLNLINDLLDLSKIEAGKMDIEIEQFDIRELLDHTMAHHKRTFEQQGITAQSDFADDMGLGHGDVQKIHQVLDNLLSNAIKFTPAGGTISVVARRIARAEAKTFLSNATADEFIQVNITDSGIGIALAEQDKLFQPFQQLDTGLNRQYEGTGLGLSLCRKIIQMHGGDIWLERSNSGEGSTFTFLIPADEMEK
jgi:PAS domain S-box-containing protein